MSALDLVIAPDPRLKTCVDPVPAVDKSVQDLMDAMLETMYKNHGIGLAAVQVGAMQRVLVAHITEDMGWDNNDDFPLKDGYVAVGKAYCMANPKIISFSKEELLLQEGCLSVPGTRDFVKRPESIIVEYTDRDGKLCTLKAERWLARCIQHEVDHLNGILFIDHLSKMKRDMALKKSSKIKKLQSV